MALCKALKAIHHTLMRPHYHLQIVVLHKDKRSNLLLFDKASISCYQSATRLPISNASEPRETAVRFLDDEGTVRASRLNIRSFACETRFDIRLILADLAEVFDTVRAKCD